MENNSVMIKLKKIWWLHLVLCIAFFVIPWFLSPSEEVLAMKEEELNMFRIVFFVVSATLVVIAFGFPKFFLKNFTNDEKVKSFSMAFFISMSVPSVAIGAYGFVLHNFTLIEEGIILSVVSFLLLAYKYPRDSHVESILGEELANKFYAQKKA